MRDTSSSSTENHLRPTPDHIHSPLNPLFKYTNRRAKFHRVSFRTSPTFFTEKGGHGKHSWTFVDTAITLDFSTHCPHRIPRRHSWKRYTFNSYIQGRHQRIPKTHTFALTLTSRYNHRDARERRSIGIQRHHSSRSVVSHTPLKSSLTLRAEREKKKNQLLADKIFGSGKRSSLPGSGNGNGRKAPTGPATLASRAGITKVRIPKLQ